MHSPVSLPPHLSPMQPSRVPLSRVSRVSPARQPINPATAHARISSAGAWGWIVPTTLQALVGAFFFSQLVILATVVVMSMLGYMFGGRSGAAYGGAYAAQAIPTGRMILAYVLMALAIFGVQVLRGVQLQLTARIGKAPSSFTAAKSPIIMHAALSTAWVLASMVVYYVAIRLMGA